MRDARIVLVNAHLKSGDYAYNNPTEHLGIAYLAAYLRAKGYGNVHLIDGYALGLSTEDMAAELARDGADIVGVTFEYNTFVEAVRLARMVKQAIPSVTVVFGGEHATYADSEILSGHPEVDFIVRGEGEITFHALCDHLTGRGPAGEDQPLAGIPGLAYRGPAGQPVRNADRSAIEDLDSLPFPARDTLERALAMGRRPAIAILGSRGCPAKCSFCNAHKFFNIGGGARWRPRSAKNIVDEMEVLLARYGGQDIYPVVYFSDENFVGPRHRGMGRVREFAERILDRGLSVEYEIFCRTDSFVDEEETVRLLRRSGLISVLMGIEAGSDEQLKALKKGGTVGKNLASVRIFQDNNISTSSSGFLMFNPYSTFRDLRRNADFLLQIGHSTLYNMSCRVHAYPGLEMNGDLARRQMLGPDYEHYKVDSIRFTDKNVQALADRLTDDVDIELLRREDSTMRDIDINMARVLDAMGGRLSEGGEFRNHDIDRLFDVKHTVQKHTHAFFHDILGRAEREELDRTTFAELYRAYRSGLEALLDSLDAAFAQALQRIGNALDEEESLCLSA